VLRDSDARLVICDDSSATVLPDSVPLLGLDASAEEVAAQPATAPPGRIEPAQLAYMLHTSGSTGRPKGVMVEHGQVANLLDWADETFEPGTTLASTSICFDLSVFELFAPLSSGGATVLVPDLTTLATSPPPAPVTLINTVPSVLAALLRDHALPPDVRTVTLCGEPLPPELARKVQHSGVADVRNLYGPTETTTFSTATGPLDMSEVTIGRPINGTRCHVLDDSLRPMPLGVPGELYLGGAGVTRGYAGRPGLTAERYLPDPFAGDGSRLYRTGDLARLRADGELELLGRNDAQLKVNGFRIEPGEIEAELARHPSVLQVAVCAVTDARDVRALAAYVVARPGEKPPDAAELRAFAARALPRHLLPHRVVLVAALPTTVSGKIDRAGLAALTDLASPPRAVSGGPMARLWAEVLGVPEVGDDDDYFDLGGTSLLSLHLLAAVHETFGVTLPPRTLFECPTPALLASAVASSEIKESVSP
jgi:amino acid adenylation domain-containing protein